MDRDAIPHVRATPPPPAGCPPVLALVGLMGCGKSTVGRALATRLARRFIDLDDDIAARAGRTIPEIFAQAGEAEFRRLEEDALGARLAEGGALVLALGGGAYARAAVERRLRGRAWTVFLDVPPAGLVARLSGAGTAGRPLLNRPDWPEHLERLWNERRPAYLRADQVLAVAADEPAEETAIRLFNLICR